MNDFTKDELIFIKTMAEMYSEADIFAKADEMIEGYCEHSETYEDYNYWPTRCKKCMGIIG